MIAQLGRLAKAGSRVAGHWLQNRIDPPVVTLLYHRVTALETDPQLLAVSPQRFHDQLAMLKRRFPIVRFEDDWTGIKCPALAITFDDGYADNFLEALPILEALEVPATFFVSTGTLGTRREFWWDELERLILTPSVTTARFTLRAASLKREWSTVSAQDRQRLYTDIHPLMKGIDAPEREEWLSQLRTWAGCGSDGRETHRPLTIPELKRFARSPLITIGGHTVTHTALASLSPERQAEEIHASCRQLEEWLGRRVDVFAYPFGGRSDYDADSVRICQEAGFTKTAANVPGQAHRWTDPQQIPRHLVRDWSAAELEKRLWRCLLT